MTVTLDADTLRKLANSARAPSVLVMMCDARGYISRTSRDQSPRRRSCGLASDSTVWGALRSPMITGTPASLAAATETTLGPIRKLTSKSMRSRFTTCASSRMREAVRRSPNGARADSTTIGTSAGGS